jgi:hypothetical protein
MAFVEEPARFCPDTAHLLLSAGPTLAHKEIGVHISERLLYDFKLWDCKKLNACHIIATCEEVYQICVRFERRYDRDRVVVVYKFIAISIY